uniref:Uncharacterized protein n=1 Tax=Arundo donax TaxID=35708 RepID=A0A0A9ETW0_ARUDO
MTTYIDDDICISPSADDTVFKSHLLEKLGYVYRDYVLNFAYLDCFTDCISYCPSSVVSSVFQL